MIIISDNNIIKVSKRKIYICEKKFFESILIMFRDNRYKICIFQCLIKRDQTDCYALKNQEISSSMSYVSNCK